MTIDGYAPSSSQSLSLSTTNDIDDDSVRSLSVVCLYELEIIRSRNIRNGLVKKNYI